VKIKAVASILIAFLVGYFVYGYLQKTRDETISNLAQQELKNVQLAYNTILETYKIAAEETAYYLTNDPKLLSLLASFDAEKSSEKKAVIRGRLYRLVYPQYRQLKKFNIEQLHFHTADGKSLLRLSAPDKSGDDLTGFRPMIRHIVLTHEPVSGFESGRLYVGYRHIFPIMDQGKYLGSVEFSNNFDIIRQQLQNSVPRLFYEMLLSKKESYDKAFADHRSFFVPSPFGHDYYVESEDLARISQKNIDLDLIESLRNHFDSSPVFRKHFLSKHSFAMPVIWNGQGYIVTFSRIKSTTGQHAGYIVSYGIFPKAVSIRDDYNLLIAIALSMVVAIWLLILFAMYQFYKIQKHSRQLQHFIDTQNSIVVLTDGKKFKYANEKFIEFFGYPGLKDFLNRHDCICEKFLDHEEGFSLKKVKQGESNWIESLLNLPPNARRVYMNNLQGVPEAFSVFINRYDATDYVINFHNINSMILELERFHTMAIRDPLTGAYNRLYYETMIQKIIEINRRHGKHTGIIFFDIDRFKTVNDLHGHSVGDTILVVLTTLVQQVIRKSDTLIRWGGEEFVVLIEAKTLEDVYLCSENLRKAIERNTFEEIGKLTASFGVSLYTGHNTVLEDISLADSRMYCAKQAGRNQVCKEER